MTPVVTVCSDVDNAALRVLLARYGLVLATVAPGEIIPGSFWKDSEAGLIGAMVYARADTPLHSVLHETCHCICMDKVRRDGLHTDAGGDYDEENAVCYLQILLAGYLPDFSCQRMFADMDAWGYSFRLGSTQRWFEDDARETRVWLQNHGLINPAGQPTWRRRA